jgi:hypothetical protein
METQTGGACRHCKQPDTLASRVSRRSCSGFRVTSVTNRGCAAMSEGSVTRSQSLLGLRELTERQQAPAIRAGPGGQGGLC